MADEVARGEARGGGFRRIICGRSIDRIKGLADLGVPGEGVVTISRAKVLARFIPAPAAATVDVSFMSSLSGSDFIAAS
jgi:hypothetical protein